MQTLPTSSNCKSCFSSRIPTLSSTLPNSGEYSEKQLKGLEYLKQKQEQDERLLALAERERKSREDHKTAMARLNELRSRKS